MSAGLEPASYSQPPRRSALRRLWQRLPQNTRRQILFDIGKLLAPHPDRAPRGGWPLSLQRRYLEDIEHIKEYARLARTDEGFAEYMRTYVLAERAAA